MLMIFGETTTQERESLGTSCKRFREIDFALSKKLFESVEIETVNIISGFELGVVIFLFCYSFQRA